MLLRLMGRLSETGGVGMMRRNEDLECPSEKGVKVAIPMMDVILVRVK
jgi:hypothetical protein